MKHDFVTKDILKFIFVLLFLLETDMTLTITIVFDWMTVTMSPTTIVFIFRETWKGLLVFEEST